MESRYRDEEAERSVLGRDPGTSALLALRTYTARLLGAEPSLVLHGGGNTSVKSREATLVGETVDVLHVKGSGWDLATIEPAGHPAARMDALLALASLPELDDEAMVNGLRLALLDARAPTPSVEALLHAILPARFVDHTHADAILVLVDQPDGEALCRRAFPAGLVWVPYTMPGFGLARACRRAWEATAARGETPRVMLLEKHGIFTFGETAKESYLAMIDAVTTAERHARSLARPAPSPGVQAPDPARVVTFLPALRGALAEAMGLPEERGPVLSLRSGDEALAFLARPDADEITRRGSVTPDHVIRTKPWPLFFMDTKEGSPRDALLRELHAYTERYDRYVANMSAARAISVKKLDPFPRIVLVPGVGVVAVGATRGEADIAADVYEHTLAVMARASDIGLYTPVSGEDLFDVEYWSLEQAKVGKKGAEAPLARRVAIVTGAASGIGKSTATRLLSEGAHVVLSDRRGAPLDSALAELRKMHSTRVSAAPCDVTRDADVGQLVDHAVFTFGGVDVVVSNAGTAPEGMLDTEAGLEALERSLDVNLLSHARVARHAARIFRLQGRGGVLLFNASKSAFNPGPGFGPYAVAKAALIALMKQLAVDLAPLGVRSNAVNADRVRTGLFEGGVLESRARARGLSPDAYFRANLLGREVLADDVARAFCHLAAARSTTGCVLTVDGGNAAAFPR